MARVIEFEGRRIEVPDDFGDADVAAVLSQQSPAAAAPASAQPEVPTPQPRPADAPVPINPLVQGVGAGLLDIGRTAGMVANPTSLLPAAANAGLRAAGQPEIPQPPSPADSMGDLTEKGLNAVGRSTTDPSAMPLRDRLPYEIARFGTQAGLTAPVLAESATARAADLARGAAPSKFTDTLLRPYMGQDIGRTVAGDIAASTGAGTAVAEASDRGYDSPLLQMLAGIGGGISGAGMLSAGAGLAKGIGRSLGGAVGHDIDQPVTAAMARLAPDPLADTSITKKASDRAATAVQDRAVDPAGAAERMTQNKADLEPYLPVLPTPAQLAQDPGLSALEREVSMRDPGPAIARQREFASGVRDTVDKVAPEGATAQPLIDRVKSAADTQMEGARGNVEQVSEMQRLHDAQRQREGDALAPYNSEAAKVDASRRLDKAVVDEGYIPARAEKNRQFDEAPGRNEQIPADDVIAAAQDVRARLNPLVAQGQQIPGEFVQRLEALGQEGGTGAARGGDLADTRKYLATAYDAAQKAGNFELANSIGRLRGAINQTIEGAPGYAEANANYRDFAGTYRPARGGPAAEFTKTIDRNGDRGGNAAPENTASKFLGANSPEASADLNRMAAASPAAGDAQHATRDYLLADMATKGVLDTRTGTIRPDRLRSWAAKRADLAENHPEFHAEVQDMLRRAQRGERLSGQMADELVAAQKTAKTTQDQIDKGAFGMVLNSDPDKAVASVMGSQNRSGRMLDELIRVTDSDPQARNGLKAAVRDYLVDKATTTASEKLKPGDERGPVSAAKLSQIFGEHEKELARIFDPEEMNTLRAGHKAMELSKESGVRVTTGSDTAEKGTFDRLRSTPLGKSVEAAMRLHFGMLKTGGMLATLRRALPEGGTATDRQVDQLLSKAAFDPELMGLLLGRKVPVGSPAWNSRLNTILGVQEGVRDSTENQRN